MYYEFNQLYPFFYSGNPAMLFVYTVWQSTRRRRVSNLSKGKKEGKEKEGRKGKKIIKITYK